LFVCLLPSVQAGKTCHYAELAGLHGLPKKGTTQIVCSTQLLCVFFTKEECEFGRGRVKVDPEALILAFSRKSRDFFVRQEHLSDPYGPSNRSKDEFSKIIIADLFQPVRNFMNCTVPVLPSMIFFTQTSLLSHKRST
jgi:hypothetical protein